MQIVLLSTDRRHAGALSLAIQMHWPLATVHEVTTIPDLLTRTRDVIPDAVVLVEGGGMCGVDMLRALRRVSLAPAVIVMETCDETDQIQLLTGGADACVEAAASPLVIVAHLESLLRRMGQVPFGEGAVDFTCGSLVINYRSRLVMVGGVRIDLSRTEYRLLEMLSRNAGRVLTHRTLIDAIWGQDGSANPDHLKVVMSRLRAKIHRDEDACPVESMRGVGYRMMRPSPRVIEVAAHHAA